MEKVILTFSFECQFVFTKFNQRRKHLRVEKIIFEGFFKLFTELGRKPDEKPDRTQDGPEHTVNFVSFKLFNQESQNAIEYFESFSLKF